MYSGKENSKPSCKDLEVTFPVLRLVSKPEFVNLRIIVKKEAQITIMVISYLPTEL